MDEIERWIKACPGDESRRVVISYDPEFGWSADARATYASEWGSGDLCFAESGGASIAEALRLLNIKLDGRA